MFLSKAFEFNPTDPPDYQWDSEYELYLHSTLHIMHSDAFFQAINLHYSNRALAGGNFYAVKNTMGEEYFIIGENVITYEKIFYQYKHGTWSPDSQIIDHYRKMFNTNNIIIVPNITYHIDCQMTYVGCGTFLVHSFEETKKFFPDEYNQYVQAYKEYGVAFDIIAAKEHQIERTVQLLAAKNFKVIKFCGTVYDVESEHDDDQMNIYGFNGIKSTFVNGIDVYSEYERQHYFVTIDSPLEKHKHYFCDIMRQLNIQPYFVRDNTGDISSTIDYISKHNGALRCQTNVVDVDKVAWERLWL